MEKFWLKIIENRANPLYWPWLVLLWPASCIYRLGLWCRGKIVASSVKTGSPVIAVGNLTTGGAGKTPTVVEICRHFLSKGKKVGVVSSGYGRHSDKAIYAFGREIIQMEIIDIGDEAAMMAELLPVVSFGINKSKSDAAAELEKRFHPDVIIVDDGYQHRRLHRDYDLLLVDSDLDLRKERLFPMGRLREPLCAIKRADLIILTRFDPIHSDLDFCNWIDSQLPGRKAVRLEFINDKIISATDKIPISDIADKRIYFFAGVGNFGSLIRTVTDKFSRVAGYHQFPDHCRYRPSDIEKVRADMRKHNPEYVVTTHKDYVKIRDFDFGRPVYYLNLRLPIDSAGKSLFEELDKVSRER
jgi:tetraacyldisaccharide 4'-kinase